MRQQCCTDCTLGRNMNLSRTHLHIAPFVALALLAAPVVGAQNAAPITLPASEASSVALPLAEDRGAALMEQDIKRLGTTASLMMIVAHPDDEDGALLTYLSRGLGVRCVLFTLTRGEGGQNVM